jgi:transposase-like protein
MSPRKLTDATKKEILKLYRETEATTSTLADRYGVSSSTISRFLKNSLSDVEYEELIQKKRLARTPRGPGGDEDAAETPEPVAVENAVAAPEVARVIPVPEPEAVETPEPVRVIPPPRQLTKSEEAPASQAGVSLTLPVMKEAIAPEEEEDEEAGENQLDGLQDLYGEDIDAEEDDDEDWDDDEDDDEDDDGDYGSESLPRTTQLQVLPLSSAAFPKTCYLVIDRSAELITRPLKDFAELGKFPPGEIQQRTLPIFDSHRVARRFSKRRERVIKVPDARVIEKVGSHLEAKGITRLLMDGQIYSLSPV